MKEIEEISQLEVGAKILVGGRYALTVDQELADEFQPGDRLCAVEKTGRLLRIPKSEVDLVDAAVSRAQKAFAQMRAVTDAQIGTFFEEFARALEESAVWEAIVEHNQRDVERAKSRGRSTTRLLTSEKMRADMIDGLRGWARSDSMRDKVLETVDHGSWKAELIGAELGVVAFVFEGRPNVVADATGVLRGGNTVVFRIGSDALSTAKAILDLAVAPALVKAGLPEGAVAVLDSTSHAAGWALFGDRRLALAVARGSGPAVDTLGAIAQSSGIPVSLHGTGGAWLMIGSSASLDDITQTVFDSLDRKVCNTLNTCCILQRDAAQFVPALLRGLERAGQRRDTSYKLHVAEGGQPFVPQELFERQVTIDRAEGANVETQAVPIASDLLGREWEWENTPEVTLKIVADLDEAVTLFNEQSPQFVACLLSSDVEERERFEKTVNAPFIGDGFTRWVDGQYALNRPELGLSNWENGRLFGRGGVLSGQSVFTVRTRVSGTGRGKPTS